MSWIQSILYGVDLDEEQERQNQLDAARAVRNLRPPASPDPADKGFLTIAGKEYLTQKDLGYEWGVCLRTVQNERTRWEMIPARFIGIMPLFTRTEASRVDQERTAARMKQLGIRPRRKK